MMNEVLFLISVITSLNCVLCYPVVIPDEDSRLNKEEKRYPNGTIVGKYFYKDKEGNPIELKYFADNANYGVEMKSIKVLGSGSEIPFQEYKQPNINNFFQRSSIPVTMESNFLNPANIKYKTNDPFQLLDKDTKSTSHDTDHTTSSDYEIYFKNEVKAPKKCGEEKVRVYFDKEKRNIRKAPRYDSLDETEQFCSKI